MRWDQIEQTFRGESVLIECVQVDEDFHVVDGNVLYHAADKEKVYRKVLELRPKGYTIEYLGEFPKDLAVML